MKRGDPLGFINILSVAKYQKIRRGDSFEKLKVFEKNLHSAEKKLESSGFVGYVKKVKNERGTLCSKFALVELGLSELISFCKKWYIRDELCGLTKKKEKKLATLIETYPPFVSVIRKFFVSRVMHCAEINFAHVSQQRIR